MVVLQLDLTRFRNMKREEYDYYQLLIFSKKAESKEQRGSRLDARQDPYLAFRRDRER